MNEKIKEKKIYIIEIVKKILKGQRSYHLRTEKKRYFIACFFKIASAEEFRILDMDINRKGGLIYNGELLYVLNNVDEYINNEKYYKKYLEDK